jgi:hypothetical protein
LQGSCSKELCTHEERRKELCELLGLIEEDLLIELLHAWRDRRASEFWTAVDQLKSFVEMKEKVCKN